MMKRTLSTLALLGFFAVSSAVPVVAAGNDTTNCQPIYGGGETCEQGVTIAVDKKVILPTNGQAVDNLGVNDPKFQPGQEIRFTIAVTNTGPAVLNDIEVTDSMPDFVTFTSGSVHFDNEDNTLHYTIDTLNPGQTVTYEVRGTVVTADALPSDQGIVCPTNTADVAVGDVTDEDAASFCIQRNVLGVVPPTTNNGQVVVPGQTVVPGQPGNPGAQPGSTVIPPTTKGGQPIYTTPNVNTTPNTGPEMFGLLGLLPSAIGGIFLRKKTK